MPTGGAQFVLQAVTFACEKDISSVYSYFPVSHRLANFSERYQEYKLGIMVYVFFFLSFIIPSIKSDRCTQIRREKTA
jgi:hypothetical protein